MLIRSHFSSSPSVLLRRQMAPKVMKAMKASGKVKTKGRATAALPLIKRLEEEKAKEEAKEAEEKAKERAEQWAKNFAEVAKWWKWIRERHARHERLHGKLDLWAFAKDIAIYQGKTAEEYEAMCWT